MKLLLGAALLLVISASITVAEDDPSERIDSLCHSWTTSRCIARVGAYLWSATSGSPLAGKKLRFVTGNTVICNSVTDASGRAVCYGIAPSGRDLVESGVRIVFEGDGHFTAESAVMKAVFRPGAGDLAGAR